VQQELAQGNLKGKLYGRRTQLLTWGYQSHSPGLYLRKSAGPATRRAGTSFHAATQSRSGLGCIATAIFTILVIAGLMILVIFRLMRIFALAFRGAPRVSTVTG